MSCSRTRLGSQVLKSLETYLQVHPEVELVLTLEESVQELVGLLERNLRANRLARFRKKESSARQVTQAQYVERLIAVWVKERERWYSLVNREESAWHTIRDQILRAAEWGLHRLGHARLDQAEDYANRACERILKGHYPFDVPLDIWIATILKNEILDRPARKDVLHHTHQSLDELTTRDWENGEMEHQVPDERAKQFVTQLIEHQRLESYLEYLAPSRAEVIRATYFEGLSDKQIAARMRKTIGQIHTLRHRALRDLRALLEQDPMTESRAQMRQSKQIQAARQTNAKLRKRHKTALRVHLNISER